MNYVIIYFRKLYVAVNVAIPVWKSFWNQKILRYNVFVRNNIYIIGWVKNFCLLLQVSNKKYFEFLSHHSGIMGTLNKKCLPDDFIF